MGSTSPVRRREGRASITRSLPPLGKRSERELPCEDGRATTMWQRGKSRIERENGLPHQLSGPRRMVLRPDFETSRARVTFPRSSVQSRHGAFQASSPSRARSARGVPVGREDRPTSVSGCHPPSRIPSVRGRPRVPGRVSPVWDAFRFLTETDRPSYLCDSRRPAGEVHVCTALS